MSTSVSKKSIDKLYPICLKNNIPFVSYCLPGSSETITLIQYGSHPRTIQVKDGMQPNVQGFLFSPFVESTKFSSYLLEPDILFSGNKVKVEVLHTLESVSFFQNWKIKEPEKLESTSKADYTNSVDQIRWLITNSELDKLVLSRIFCSPRVPVTDITAIVSSLFSNFPKAFRYIINIPDEGIWLGASPEPLLTIKNNEAGLVSLAGTQRLNGVPVSQLQWQSKEINEQYIVSDYIENVLGENGITGYTSKGPIGIAAANVVHLQTQFIFPSSLVKNKMGGFIATLHPTPSISGKPKEKALELISQFEKHSRRYYTGFLGPVNFKGDTHLFINLRCLRFSGNRPVLYAGAGITEGSVAENEWEETNQKLEAMLSILKTTAID